MRAVPLALSLSAVAVAAVAGYITFDMYMGKRAVHELCEKDGGLRVYKTVESNGYLDETVNPLYCYSCLERLAKQQFEYIDVHVSGDPATTHPLAIQRGYYRLSLATQGDPRCARWSKNVNLGEWAKQLSQFGVSANQCVAVDALAIRPSEPVLTSSYKSYASDGEPDVRLREVAIRDSITGEGIAILRDYYSFLKVDRISWDPPNVRASCGVSKDSYIQFGKLESITRPSTQSSQRTNAEHHR
jgi:hypothetical protein